MGISYNDRIKIGKYSFDLQIEIKDNLIIGEIFYNGKVLKSIKKKRDLSIPETIDVHNVHNYLRQLLINKIISTSNGTKKLKELQTRIFHNSEETRKKILKLLDLEEGNLELFLYKSKQIKITSFSNSFSNRKWADRIEKFLNKLEEINKKIPKISNFRSLLLILDQNSKKFSLLVLNYQNSRVVFVFSNTKLSFIRKNINKIPHLLSKIL